MAWALTKLKAFASLPADFDIIKAGRSIGRSHRSRTGAAEVPRRLRLLREFVEHKLRGYGTQRNKPEIDHTSRLSPYLHFGQISPVTVALAVEKSSAPGADKEAFLNQLITWRELAVNLVRFNPDYDNFECAEAWAHRTLAKHAADPRPVRLSANATGAGRDPRSAVERGADADGEHRLDAQLRANVLGQENTGVEPLSGRSLRIAVRLNDKYELDGRDPNGYAGIAWAIVGKFDRPWFERPIFGQIRYMSGASTGQKFDSKKYIRQNLSAGLF